MNPLKKPLPAYVLVFTAVMILIGIACNKGISTNKPTTGTPNNIPPDQTVTASIQGRVVDQNGVPVQGAAVNSGTATTTTDINGVFSFSAISMSSRFGYVQVVKSGYFTGSRSIITNPGASNFVTIQLMPRSETATFSGATGGSIAIRAGDTATFSDSSVVNASTNAAYTGTVHVFATYLDPTDPNLYKYMPGDLRGIGSDGYETALQSFGMLLVELQDDAGNKLQLASNHTATLTWAIPASLQSVAPTTIPLWYFNDSTGRWIEQGSANRSGNSYVGTVSHFTFWNCDASSGTVNFKVHIKDQFGNALPYAYVQFTSQQWGTRGGYTDSSGFAQGLIPKGQSLVMQVVTSCGTVLGGINVGPAIQDQDLGTVTITVPDDQLTLSGTVVDCSDNPVDSGYVNVTVDGLVYRATVAKGAFTIPVNRCFSTTVPVTLLAVDLTAQQVGPDTTINESIGKVDVGQLSACGNPFTQYFNLTINGVGYSITTPPNSNSFSYTAYNIVGDIGTGQSQSISLYTQATLTGAGTYQSNLVLFWPNTNYSYINAVQTSVTAFGAVGGYISGQLSGTMMDTVKHQSYPVTGTFKVQRTQ